MNSIEKQIRDTYEKAFYDSIDNEINSKNPDYDWIVSLYSEIKNRIIKYVKKTSKTYKQIDEEFDIELFRQMIENDVFNMDSLLNLINNTYKWVEQLQAPIRDAESRESKQRVLSTSPDKLVSTFIKEVNKCIDFLDEDFLNFVETKQNGD